VKDAGVALKAKRPADVNARAVMIATIARLCGTSAGFLDQKVIQLELKSET
jgi:hypothetical protein